MASPAGFHLNAKQVEATELLSGPQRHTLLVGGARSSKTFTLVRAILIRAFKAPSRHVIFRLRYNAVRRSVWLDTLPKVMRLCFPGVRAIFHDQDGYLQLPSRKAGEPSEIWVAGLDDKDRVERILGMEFSSLMFNECSQIPYSSVVMALTRLSQKVDGLQNRAYYDLNPVGKGHYSHQIFIEKKSPDSLQRLPDPDNYKYLFMNPKDNAENIDPEYIKTLESLPARARARFLEGLYIDQYQGQLWSLEKIDEGRIDDPHDAPIMRRTIVGVDPSGASGMFDLRSDEIGIVTCGRAPAPLGWKGNAVGEHGYVLEDNTGLYSPEQWARAACSAYYKHHADCIVAEKNFGGDMVRSTIHACDPNVPVKLVTASHGKVIRAEPIAAIYEQDRIHHIGAFPALESELTNFTTAGYMGGRSPNRADAAIWSCTELLPEQAAHGLLGLWERQAKEMKDTAPLRPTPENLAAAQKNDDWVNRLTGIAKPVNGKPVMIMRCPACHNEKLTLYSEAFACICGAKGSLALLHSEEVSHGIDVS